LYWQGTHYERLAAIVARHAPTGLRHDH